MQLAEMDGRALRLQAVLDEVQHTIWHSDAAEIAAALRARALIAGVRFSSTQLDRMSDEIAHGRHVHIESTFP